MTRSLDQALLQGADISAMANSNLLVNGFMEISQQSGTNATTTTSGAGLYVLDQWGLYFLGGYAFNAQQVTSPFPSCPEIKNGLKVTTTTAGTPGAGDQAQIYQPVEGTNLTKLAFGTVNAKPLTIAFMARSSVDFVGGVRLFSQQANRAHTHRFALKANVDTLVTYVVPGDQVGALLTTAAASLQLSINFASGSNSVTPNLDVWQAFSAIGPTDMTNLGAAVGNNLIVSSVVMIPGRLTITQDMLPLLARSVDDELRKCQRYYAKTYRPEILPGTANNDDCLGHVLDASQTYPSLNWDFPVTMRTAPTLTAYSTATGASGKAFALVANKDVPIGFNFTGVKRTLLTVAATSVGASDTLIGHAVANARM